MKSLGIHWFRRDLRLDGNPALNWSLNKHEGRVLCIFVFDRKFLSRPDFSVNRFQFFLNTLVELQNEIREKGGDLLFMDEGPLTAFPKLLQSVSSTLLPETVSWNRDYEPFARERDSNIERVLLGLGVSIHTERDHLLIEPHEIHRGEDPAAGYQVYTPFAKRWQFLLQTSEVKSRLENKKCRNFAVNCDTLGIPRSDLLEQYQSRNAAQVTVPIPQAGPKAALKRLQSFREKLNRYGLDRDIPSLPGTSGFSIYLKNGSLTVAEIIRKLDLLKSSKFLSELIWREFYYHILWRYPRNETEAFQRKFANVRWENREDWFEAWKNGQTGFPIVDAGMRQLNQRGWMHNRVRMIVASFLTKDLLIDWRWGERYFMERLLDGDLAPNNGGWQWAASVGCDPQPYFRIFNPALQSRKFDPKGDYIRKYVPELKHLSAAEIHEPPSEKRGIYPAPIVDHSERRDIALNAFKSSAQTPEN